MQRLRGIQAALVIQWTYPWDGGSILGRDLVDRRCQERHSEGRSVNAKAMGEWTPVAAFNAPISLVSMSAVSVVSCPTRMLIQPVSRFYSSLKWRPMILLTTTMRAFFVEKTKRSMIAEDIRQALLLVIQ